MKILLNQLWKTPINDIPFLFPGTGPECNELSQFENKINS